MTKKPEYYTAIREDILQFVPRDARTVLEVGCGAGLTGKAVKDRSGQAAEVTGIEIVEDAAKEAKKVLDKVIVGNVETMELPFSIGYFDCIIYGDVLEHLVDPWSVLKAHREYLKPGGVMVISIPNIAHYRTMKMLKSKRWDYADRGVLDKTHLRFFALNNITELVHGAGLEIVKIHKKLSGSKSKKFFNKVLRGAMDDMLTEQYIVVAKR